MKRLLQLSLLLLPITLLAQVPTITSFTPTSGPIGTTVTITGSNFNPTASNNEVYIGGNRAAITSASSTQIKVTVPASGSPSNISVTDIASGKTGFSAQPFNVTYGCTNGCTIVPSSFGVAANNQGGGFMESSTADFDRDGKLDLVGINVSKGISVYPNTSTLGQISLGSRIDYIFDPNPNPNTGSSYDPYNIGIGDLDGDGKLDIVVSCFSSYWYRSNPGSTFIFRNTSVPGSISFSMSMLSMNPPVGGSVITMADFDSDGKIDIAAYNSWDPTYYGQPGQSFTVLKNTSIPGSVSFAPPIQLSGGGNAQLISGDIDGDGKPEIVGLWAAGSSCGVSILRNTSSGGLISFSSNGGLAGGFTGGYPDIEGVSIYDLDGDNKNELIITKRGPTNAVGILPNQSTIGNISFGPEIDISVANLSFGVIDPLYYYSFYPVTPAIGDLDGDRKPDLVFGTKSISMLINTSVSGAISFSSSLNINPVSICSPSIGDFDGDGAPELASNTSGITILKRGTPQTITFNPNPIPNLCFVGQTLTLNATASSGLPVIYSSSNPNIVSVSGNVITANNGGYVTITASQPGNSNYGTAANVSQTFSVQYSNPATISASGSTTFCQGGSVTLTASAGSSYLWSTGETTRAINVTTSGNYSVTVNNSICSATSSVTTVTVNPLPIATITPSGPTTFCQNTSQNASVTLTVSAASGYLWSTGATTQAIIANASGNYSVTVTNSNNCSVTSSSTAVTVNPPTSISSQSTPARTVCLNGTLSAMSATAGGTSLAYQWYSNTTSSNSGGTVISGATASSYTPPSTTAGTRYYYVVVSGACGSLVTSVVSGAVTVNSPTSIPSQSTSAQTVCLNGTLSAMSVTAGGTAPFTYQWYRNATSSNSGGTVISGATASSYTPPSTTAGTRYYYVVVSGACGSLVTSVVSGAVTVNSPTSIPSQSTSAQTVCLNGTLSAMSVTAGGTAPFSYQWYSNTTSSNSGGTVISGATASSYTPPSTTAGTKYYYVVVSGACGSVTSNVSGAITVNPSPSVTITPSGPTTFCQGGSVTLTASTSSAYGWSTGANTQAITVNAAGTYSVTTPPNTYGCSGVASVIVTVNQPATTLTASVTAPNGTNLCIIPNTTLYAYPSGTGYSYCWHGGGFNYCGPDESLTVSNGSTYVVIVTNLSACQTGTATITIYKNACRVAADKKPFEEKDDTPQVTQMTAYPNPSNDVVTIAMPWNAKDDTQVQLFDMFGKLLTNATLKKGEWKTDLSVTNCADGLYIVKVGNGDLINSVKVMVVHK